MIVEVETIEVVVQMWVVAERTEGQCWEGKMDKLGFEKEVKVEVYRILLEELMIVLPNSDVWDPFYCLCETEGRKPSARLHQPRRIPFNSCPISLPQVEFV